MAYGENTTLEQALKHQRLCHQEGKRALVELETCRDREEALTRLAARNCTELDWIDS